MIYLFLAEGFEEVETITPMDYLRRAGMNLVTVGATGKTVTGAHGISIAADISIDEIRCDDELEGIILPGGGVGTKNLESSDAVQKAMDFCAKNNRLVAAICAAPMIPGHKNLLRGLEATCYPGIEGECHGAKMMDAPVCCAKNFITARCAGAATQFSARIIEYFKGAALANQVLEDVQWER